VNLKQSDAAPRRSAVAAGGCPKAKGCRRHGADLRRTEVPEAGRAPEAKEGRRPAGLETGQGGPAGKGAKARAARAGGTAVDARQVGLRPAGGCQGQGGGLRRSLDLTEAYEA
jgi:hypothetical protein